MGRKATGKPNLNRTELSDQDSESIMLTGGKRFLFINGD